VLERIQVTGERFGVVTQVACQLGVATESLRCWVEGRDLRRPPGVTTKERRRIAELEREHRQSAAGQRNPS
jgi:hypothetical protein